MFSIENKFEYGFDKIILKDDLGTIAEVLPACGAILHSFSVIQNDKQVNVIESFESLDDFKNNVTSKGFLGCKLSPFVCRINNGEYHFAENNYKFQKFYLGKNALHGLIYDQSYTVVDEYAGNDKASVSMKFEYRKEDPGYPFNYDCTVTYELVKNNKLNIITLLENKDEGLIPVQDGWHPYFNLGAKVDELQLEFQSKEVVEFNKELIPTGKTSHYEEFGSLKKIGDTSFDHCFNLDLTECQPMCVLRNHEKKIEVELHSDASYPYLQIYTPSHRNSIALENLSGWPDGFNNGVGLITLSPGGKTTFKMGYKITLL